MLVPFPQQTSALSYMYRKQLFPNQTKALSYRKKFFPEQTTALPTENSFSLKQKTALLFRKFTNAEAEWMLPGTSL